MPYPTVPSPTLYDVPFIHNTTLQTDDRQTDRTSYHKRGRTTQYGRLKIVVFHHYIVLMVLFVSSWTTTVSLSGMYLSIVSPEKRYKYRFIVSQILIQDIFLKMYLDTRYKIHFLE